MNKIISNGKKGLRIPIEKGQWLTKALEKEDYTNIPSNVILKKTLPGLGATYGEIKAKRHSIIIEPNVPVITGKTKDKAKLFGVYEGTTEPKIEKYLKDDSIKYKKLITTPESFKLIKGAILNTNVKFDLYKDFFCLFDECEKLIQDIDYRESIIQPINDFFKFENKAFVSATVLDMTHPKFKEQGFEILEVKPSYDYKKDLDLIITNSFEVDLIKKLEELRDSECICIFLNKTDSIDKIVNSLKLKDEAKIFCSDKSAKKLRKKGYENVHSQIDLPLKKYNFFTCRFFSAVDIEIRERPDILILTILKDANHTMIDPFTESIQIYGRFRHKEKYHGEELPFRSLTHITDLNVDFKEKTRDEIDREIETYKNTYENQQNIMNLETNKIARNALQEDLGKLTYADFLDDEGEFNYFSQDNLYHSERVKGYYSNPQLLIDAYNATNHFNLNTPTINNELLMLKNNWFQKRNRPTKEIRKSIIQDLKKLEEYNKSNKDVDIISHKNLLRNIEVSAEEMGDLMIDAYEYLGVEEVERIGYASPKKLKNAINKVKMIKKEYDSFREIQNLLQKEYSIEDTPTRNDTVEKLSDCYRLLGIDIRVTQSTIKRYCDVTTRNGTPPTYRICSFYDKPQ